MAGTTNYPGALDTTTNLPIASALATVELDGDGNANKVHSNLHGVLSEAAVAIEGKIGTGASTPIASRVLRGSGTGTSAWAQVALATDVSGTLPLASLATGALDSGFSITSGFGTIDNGSSSITTTGTVATGALTVGGALDAESYVSIGNGSALSADKTILVDRDFTSTGGSVASHLFVKGEVTLGASGYYHGIQYSSTNVITANSGTHPNVNMARLSGIAVAGAATVTNLATLAITAAPTYASGTLTNPSGAAATEGWALHVADGWSYFGDDVAIAAAKKLFLDGGSDTYIYQESADDLHVVVGGVAAVQIDQDAGGSGIMGIGIGAAAAPVDYAQLRISGNYTTGNTAAAIGTYFDSAIIGISGMTGNLAGVYLANDLTTQTATESISTASLLYLRAPTITDNLTGAITVSSTLYIAGEPTSGVGTTNAAIYVASGDVINKGDYYGGTVVDSQYAAPSGAAALQLAGDSDSAPSSINLVSGSTNIWHTPSLNMMKSHNVLGSSPTIVVDNEQLGYIRWIPDDGVDFLNTGAQIQVMVNDASPAANAVGTEMIFWTSAEGSVAAEKMMISRDGDLAINAGAKLYLDGWAGSGNTYIQESSADNLVFHSGGLALTLDSSQDATFTGTVAFGSADAKATAAWESINTQSVSTSSVVIANPTAHGGNTSYGYMAYVNGVNTINTLGFYDILYIPGGGYTNAPQVLHSLTNFGSPAARTYLQTVSGDLFLAMASGTYDVTVTMLIGKHPD